MMPPKCYTWLESCGSQLSDGKNEKLFFCILQSVGFSMTLRTDIFLYTENLSYRLCNTVIDIKRLFCDIFCDRGGGGGGIGDSSSWMHT